MHSWYPRLVLAEFAAFWVVLYTCRRQVCGIFREVPRKAWFVLAAVVLFGFLVRARGLHVYETYFDGYEYGVATQSLARTGEFHACTLRVDGVCLQKWLPTHPPASNLLYALVMAVRGTGEKDFFDATVTVGTLSIIVIFAAAFLLFGETAAALWAALLLSALPIHIKLSSAGMLEIGEVFYALLLLCSLLLLKEKPGRRTLLLVALSTLLLIQSRAEAILFLALAPLPAYFFCKDLRLGRRVVLGAGLVLLALALVDAFYVTRITTSYNGLGVERNMKGFSLSHLADNLLPNLVFYFDNSFHPVSYTLLALAGVYWTFRKKIAVEHIFLLGWFSAYSLLFVLYGPDFGRYAYCESQHFALSTYPPLILAAAAGITATLGAARGNKGPLALFLATLILSNAHAFDSRYLRAYGPASPQMFYELAFVRSLKDRLPANAFIITINPNIIFATTDFPGSEMLNFAKEEAALSRLARRDRFDYYFLEDSWCDHLARIGDDRCDAFKRDFDPQLVAAASHGRDKLYRMRPAARLTATHR